MHSVCCCSLPVWRKSFLKKRTPMTYFCPALDPPLGEPGRKTTTLVRGHEYFIPTNFYQNPSSSSGEEVESAKVYRRTCDGWHPMTWFPEIMTYLFQVFWGPFSRSFQGLFFVFSNIHSRRNDQQFKNGLSNKTYRDHLILSSPEKWWGSIMCF